MRPIATIASPISGDIVVYRDRATGLLTYTQGGYEQSAADRNGVSTASYVHALYGLVRQTRAADILIVGCGGGSLARLLLEAGARVAVVDIDPASFDLARWYFGLPETCECNVADGRAYLEADRRLYDAIVLDAYHAGDMPAHLADRSFFALVKRRLAARGAFFVNAFVRGDEDPFADDVSQRLRQVWRTVRVLDMKTRINRNAIVMAGAVEHLAQPTLITAPEIESDDIARDLRAMEFSRA
jgi:spermidine synthase